MCFGKSLNKYSKRCANLNLSHDTDSTEYRSMKRLISPHSNITRGHHFMPYKFMLAVWYLDTCLSCPHAIKILDS